LLGGQTSQASAKQKRTKTSVKSKASKKSKTSSANDDEFDAAAFLLGDSAIKEKGAEKSSERKKDVYDNDNYDASKYRIKESASSSTDADWYPSDKPDNETLLAFAFDLKGAINFDGTIKKEGNDMELSEQSDYGVSVSAEHYAYLTKLFALGLGLEYNFQRYLNETGRYSFLPFFVAAKMRVISDEIYHIYATARLGYGVFMANSSYWLADVHSGFYCAGGIGASYDHFTLQLLYSYNGGSLNYKVAADEIDVDVSFSKLGIYFGYLF
jgi:hypothetical protein